MRELNEKVPIHQKIALTISCAVREEPADAVRARHLKEAAEYSNIGINKIDQMLRTPNCPFVLFVGTKKLVKRKEFEEFIHDRMII